MPNCVRINKPLGNTSIIYHIIIKSSRQLMGTAFNLKNKKKRCSKHDIIKMKRANFLNVHRWDDLSKKPVK